MVSASGDIAKRLRESATELSLSSVNSYAFHRNVSW